MKYLGSLKDKRIGELIVNRLKEMGIESVIETENESFHILITDEKHFDQALDVYRITLGFPPLTIREIPEEWQKVKKLPMGAFTLNMLILCVGIYLLSFTEYGKTVFDSLLISDVNETSRFSSVLQGQGWRVITPIFLHFNFMHILFNMLWLKDLGKLIEYRKGGIFFFFFILLSGILSNIPQYLINGPSFGGMSGVVYALLGYLWIEKVLSKDNEFSLPKEDIFLMVGWYVLCMTGLFGPIANVAHGVGLSVGMFWGIISLLKQMDSENRAQFFKYSALAIVLPAISIVVELFKEGLV